MRRADPDAAGLTDEQARIADAGVKGMIPIGRPFLDFVISALADAGITDVCLVIGPEHDAMRSHYASGVTRVRVHFAVQEHPLGTANAVAAAEAFAGADTVLVLNADNYYPVDAYRQLADIRMSGLVGFESRALVAESNIPAERVRAFALVTTAMRPEPDSGPGVVSWPLLTSIVEKPDAETYNRLAATSLVSMNLWSFTPAIFEACRMVKPSSRGELELQDAVRIAKDGLGELFVVVPYAGGVLDLSSRGDIPAVAAALAEVRVAL